MPNFKKRWIFFAFFCLNISSLSGKTNSKLGFIFPYLSLEKYVVAQASEFENLYGEKIILEQWNMLTGGIEYKKSVFFSTVSIAGLWHDHRSQFLPVLDVNLGINIKNYYIYGGKNFSLVKDNLKIIDEETIELTNPIYLGGKYLCQIKNMGLEFGVQISRGKLYEFDKETYFSYTFNSKMGYKVKEWLHPYISVSVEKLDFSRNLLFNVSIGIAFGRSSSLSGIRPRIKAAPFIRVFKPNIYLYPQETTKIKVLVKPNGKITTSIPPYRNGWNVTAFPDGTIEDTAGYLFYEADVFLHHSEKGWCVPLSGMNPFLKKTLKEYGFNDIEIKDFLDYWTKKLPESSFYAIYPVTGISLEEICPLKIEPSPDKILRLWFIFTPLSEEKHIDAPEIQSFARTGFVVTEWGGIIKK